MCLLEALLYMPALQYGCNTSCTTNSPYTKKASRTHMSEYGFNMVGPQCLPDCRRVLEFPFKGEGLRLWIGPRIFQESLSEHYLSPVYPRYFVDSPTDLNKPLIPLNEKE